MLLVLELLLPLSGRGLVFVFFFLPRKIFLLMAVGAGGLWETERFPQTHAPYYRKCIGLLDKGLRE
jgi:hypothetical protein